MYGLFRVADHEEETPHTGLSVYHSAPINARGIASSLAPYRVKYCSQLTTFELPAITVPSFCRPSAGSQYGVLAPDHLTFSELISNFHF